MSIAKPAVVFDRDAEWAALDRFVSSAAEGARLGIVYGRRRQGKTMLLEALRDQAHGFYWQARQQSSAQNLSSLSAALSAHLARSGAVVPVRLADWDEAARLLVGLGVEGPTPVLVDEVGYVVASEPSFPSHLQAALSPLGPGRRGQVATRLVLCGSALGQMRRLVDVGAPLRGRADLELVVTPFDFRTAAVFWGLEANPDAAFRLHALIGGTPAYRDFTGGDLPVDGDVDGWACRNLLEVSSPLNREGRVVVGEDPSLVDQALHWSVLGAIADGAERRSEITRALGRPPTSLQHALVTLREAGWVREEPDPLRARRSRFVLDEPIVRTHRLVIEPNDARLSLRRSTVPVWQDALPVVRSRVYGPHLEHLARTWLAAIAAEATVEARLALVGPSTLRLQGADHQLDVVGVASTGRGGRRVAVVGEVKASTSPVPLAELERLDHLVDAAGWAPPPRRLLVGRGGFTGELLQRAARRPDVVLVDLHRLYHGD